MEKVENGWFMSDVEYNLSRDIARELILMMAAREKPGRNFNIRFPKDTDPTILLEMCSFIPLGHLYEITLLQDSVDDTFVITTKRKLVLEQMISDRLCKECATSKKTGPGKNWLTGHYDTGNYLSSGGQYDNQ